MNTPLRKVAAIARVTFFDIVRDKVLYNIFLIAVLLLGVAYLASRLTFIRPERVVLDFGFSAIGLSCAILGVFFGASMIGREFERRTVSMALSRPVSRGQFVWGKFGGLAMVLLVNWLLLSLTYVLLLGVAAGTDLGLGPGSGPYWTLALGLILILLQSWILAGLSVLFSTFSTASLSVVMTLGFYLIGNNISQIRAFAEKLSPGARILVKGSSYFLPNLEALNLGTRVTYGLPVTYELAGVAIAYGLALSALLVVLAGVLLRGKEV